MSETKIILSIIDGDATRARALATLRTRLGREPTAADLEAERARERAIRPLAYLIYPTDPEARAKFRAVAETHGVTVAPPSIRVDC